MKYAKNLIRDRFEVRLNTVTDRPTSALLMDVRVRMIRLTTDILSTACEIYPRNATIGYGSFVRYFRWDDMVVSVKTHTMGHIM